MESRRHLRAIPHRTSRAGALLELLDGNHRHRGGKMIESITAREERAARNQSIFREVNERLEALGEEFQDQEYQRFVCECARPECIQPIELTVEEYERIRGRGSTFFVAPGHIYPDVERAVYEDGRFTVVEKINAGGELAEAFDPRSI
jgi:hypothetical protein